MASRTRNFDVHDDILVWASKNIKIKDGNTSVANMLSYAYEATPANTLTMEGSTAETGASYDTKIELHAGSVRLADTEV